MTLAAILELILGVLKFPAEVSALIKLLSASPDERRQKIMADMQKQLDDFQNTGRPA